MAENPTSSQVLQKRRDLQDYIQAIGNGATIGKYVTEANAQFKRSLRDIHDIKFSQIYDSDNSIYFVDTDGDANNDDRAKHLIGLLAIAYVFRDYSIATAESSWFDLYLHYKSEYDSDFSAARFDVDLNEDGTISEGEERQTTQSFLVR